MESGPILLAFGIHKTDSKIFSMHLYLLIVMSQIQKVMMPEKQVIADLILLMPAQKIMVRT